MENILLLDSNRKLLKKLQKKFDRYHSQFTILTADSGPAAIQLIADRVIAVIVTGIFTLDIDLLQIAVQIAQRDVKLLCFIMTGDTPPACNKSSNNYDRLQYTRRTTDVDSLAAIILEGLMVRDEGGLARNIASHSLLQAIESTGNTCLVGLSGTGNDKGVIYFHEGTLHDAMSNYSKGSAAVVEMAQWQNLKLSLRKSPHKPVKRRIFAKVKEIFSSTGPVEPTFPDQPEAVSEVDSDFEIDSRSLSESHGNRTSAKTSKQKGLEAMADIKELLEGLITRRGNYGRGQSSRSKIIGTGCLGQ